MPLAVFTRPGAQRRPRPDLRLPLGIGRAQQRAGFGQACRSGLHIGIGFTRTLHQSAEFGVGKYPPPGTARLGLGRGGLRPARGCGLGAEACGHGNAGMLHRGRCAGATRQHQGCRQRAQGRHQGSNALHRFHIGIHG
jgi:hypothetical protein